MVVLGTDQEGYSCLVEATSLAIPLLDRVECALACEVEHEEDSDGVIAHQRKHIDEFSLTTQIPD